MYLKRIIVIPLLIILHVSIFGFSNYEAKGLADENGRLLISENENLVHPLASLTKIMTLLVVTEKIESKEISLYDTVTITKEAGRLRGSTAHLNEGDKVTVEELFKAALIHSGNDAAYALAQFSAGSVENFVALMNKKAYELGLKDTTFRTPTGLPRIDGNLDVSTIADVSKLVSEVIKHPIFLRYSSLKETTIRTWNHPLRTTNKLLGKYEGVDGLKTGYHGTAGYNTVVTAERAGKRFIAVVFGAPSDTIRTLETQKLLNFGFDNFEKVNIGKKGDIVCQITLSNSKERKLTLVLDNDVSVLINKNDMGKLTKTAIINKHLRAPVKQSDSVGFLILSMDNVNLGKHRLAPESEVPKLSWFRKLIRFITFNKV